MSLQPQKTVINTGVPVFQHVDRTAQGGFVLDTTGLTVGGTIPAGQPMTFDESTRKAAPLIVAQLQANAANNATVYKVLKGHLLAVGQNIGAAVGGTANDITAIDTTNTDYDSVTLSASLGVALNAGDVVFVSPAKGANAAALSAVPKGLLKEDTDIQVGNDLAVVLEGVIYERRAPKCHSAIKSALPNIIFSQSY
jgi:hypothetical protein